MILKTNLLTLSKWNLLSGDSVPCLGKIFDLCIYLP